MSDRGHPDPATEPGRAAAAGEAAVVDESSPAAPAESGPPAAPPSRSALPGCLRIVAGGLLLLLIGGGVFVATWRPFPPLPPTGLLTATATSAVLSLDGGAAATIPVHVSVDRAQPKDRGTGWARPRITATMTGATGEAVTIAVETPDGGPVVAGSNASTSGGLVTWDGSCPDASACRLDYLVVVANASGSSATMTIKFDARMEYPLSVPAPDGAALALAIDPVGEPGATVAAGTTGEAAIDVDPAGAPVIRRLGVHVPRAESGAAATWLVLDALLVETDPGPDPSRLAAGSTAGPLGKLTIDGIATEPIVQDLVGEPRHLVVGPIAACSTGCELDLGITVESLEVRPGARLRLDWSARIATVTRRGGSPPPGAVAVTMSTLESSPIASTTASGTIRITRKATSGGATIRLQLDAPAPATDPGASTPAALARAFTGTATVELSVDVTGSTRRVVIPVNVTSPNAMRFPGAGVTVASGAPTRLLATPFQTCSNGVTCQEGIAITTQLSGALVSILSDDETVLVHWTVGVSVSRVGPAVQPEGEPPTLTITSGSTP